MTDELKAAAEADDLKTGVWFQSAVSGLWYRNAGSAGAISAVAYDEDDVSQLNEWGIWAFGEIERLEAEVERLKQSCELWAEQDDLLRWTDEPPTEPGWYFYRRSPVTSHEMVKVELTDGKLFVDGWQWQYCRSTDPKCQIAGPIPEPQEQVEGET